MARPRPSFYNTIEYIGPRPQRPKRSNFFGGWVILAIAAAMGCWFGRPLLQLAKAQEGVSMEKAEVLISTLRNSSDAGDRLAAAAIAHSEENITFDPAYYKIAYPNGDIPAGKGGSADVVIRCLRKLGVDLQKEVHEDMTAHFRFYPQLWNAIGPDSNIDHRRVANLQRFFERKGETLTASRDPKDYHPGDIVVWSLANADKHIGIIVPGPGTHMGESWVVHNMGQGVKWENTLIEYKIEAHFRYPAANKAQAAAPKENAKARSI